MNFEFGFSVTLNNSWLRLGHFWCRKKLPSCLFPTYTDLKPFWQFLAWWLDAVSKHSSKIPKRRQESLCSSQFAFFVRLLFSRLSLASSSIPGKERSVLWSFLQPWYRNIPPRLAVSIWRLWHLKICFWSLPLSITYCLISATGNKAKEVKWGIWSWGEWSRRDGVTLGHGCHIRTEQFSGKGEQEGVWWKGDWEGK